MKRREFMARLGGAAAWPIAARAQQPAMPVIGLLNPNSLDTGMDRVRGFRQRLKDTGFVEGENVAIDYRSAENQNDRLPGLAAELVHRRVSVIAAFAPAAVFAAKAATTTIPIAFAVNEDPVRLGLVASLARPGGNTTSVDFVAPELAAKRLPLVHELRPDAARTAVLVNATNPTITESTMRDLTAAAPVTGRHIQVLNATTTHEITEAFATSAGERPD